MTRRMHLNLFIQGRGHHEASWRHPRSSKLPLTDIRYTAELAQKAEAGLFDSIFLADVLGLWHDRVREAEAQVQAVAADASEKLRQAEMRVEASEKAYRELLATVDRKLREASAAVQLAEANTRIETEKRTAAEHRAQQAEAAARGAMRSLWSVEEAIRKKLLARASQSTPLAKAC